MSMLDDSMLPKVKGESNSKEAWDILKHAYQGNDKLKTIRLQNLQTQFETLKTSYSDIVDSFMTKVMGIVNQLRINGEMIQDQNVVEKTPQESSK